MQFHRTPALADELAFMLEAISDQLANVLLRDDELHSESRRTLSRVARVCKEGAAKYAAVGAELDEDAKQDAWVDSWFHHIGSIDVLPVIGRPQRALHDAHLAWLDEIDEMTDRDLLALPGIGRRTLATLREFLDVYYWRGDPDASRAFWTDLQSRLQLHIEAPYLRERDRVLDGLRLTRAVLDSNGSALSDPAAARKAIR